jgi:hypothetical protein
MAITISSFASMTGIYCLLLFYKILHKCIDKMKNFCYILVVAFIFSV